MLGQAEMSSEISNSRERATVQLKVEDCDKQSPSFSKPKTADKIFNRGARGAKIPIVNTNINTKQEMEDLGNALIEQRKREARSQSRPTRPRLHSQI